MPDSRLNRFVIISFNVVIAVCQESIQSRLITTIFGYRAVFMEFWTKKKTLKSVFNSYFGGAGGSRTRVQKAYILGTTCLVAHLFNQLDAKRQASSW